jgi:hypothetical protein
MDVLTLKPGDRVIFCYPNNGYTHEQKVAAEKLIVGEVYTLAQLCLLRNLPLAWTRKGPGGCPSPILRLTLF